MKIIHSYLEDNPCYRAGKKIKIKGLMLHSVGCAQPSAQVFVNKWNSQEARRACVHGFIDGNTGEIYQTLPWDYKGWHCGGMANGTHIGIEMCEPSCIRYIRGSNVKCSNIEVAKEVINRTYQSAVELFAFLCEKFKLNPLQDGVIISHKEGHDRGLASNHGDPEHLWKQLSRDFTMEAFRLAVHNKVSFIEEDVSIQTGDCVKIADDAVYYDGKEMPNWVKEDSWIVSKITDDRVVINQNQNGSKAINSPVNVKYLIKKEAFPFS